MKKIKRIKISLPSDKQVCILDMHNDPKWAMQQLQKMMKSGNYNIITTQSSLDEFYEKASKPDIEIYNKHKQCLQILPDFF